MNDSLLISTLLQTSLDNLKRKGFPVDRILNIAPRKKVIETPKSTGAMGTTDTSGLACSTPERKPVDYSDKQLAEDTAKKVSTMEDVFPDCAPEFLVDFVKSELLKNPRITANDLVDKLSQTSYPKSTPLSAKESKKSGATNSDHAPPPPYSEKPVKEQLGGKSAPDSRNPNSEQKQRGIVSGELNAEFAQPGKEPPASSRNPNRKKSSGKKSWKSFFGIEKITSKDSLLGASTSASGTYENPRNTAASAETIRKHHDEHLNNALNRAVKQCKHHGGGDFWKEEPQIQAEPDPGFTESSGCNPSKAQSLKYVSSISVGHTGTSMDLYFDEPIYDKYCQCSQFGEYPVNDFLNMFLGPKENMYDVDMAKFVNVLYCLGVEVFELSASCIHVFIGGMDDPTIAFNRGGSLFFNLRFFVTFDGPLPNPSESRADKNYAITYKCYLRWFMTFCHELAHCFRGPHDKVHEDYLSSYAEKYFVRMDRVVRGYGINPDA